MYYNAELFLLILCYLYISAMQLVVISYNRTIYYQLYEHMKHKMQGKLHLYFYIFLSHHIHRHQIFD